MSKLVSPSRAKEPRQHKSTKHRDTQAPIRTPPHPKPRNRAPPGLTSPTIPCTIVIMLNPGLLAPWAGMLFPSLRKTPLPREAALHPGFHAIQLLRILSPATNAKSLRLRTGHTLNQSLHHIGKEASEQARNEALLGSVGSCPSWCRDARDFARRNILTASLWCVVFVCD